MSVTLREARVLFTWLLCQLVLKAVELGFEPAFDEITERQTNKDKQSDHMSGSLHHLGLAGDLLLYKVTEEFKDGFGPIIYRIEWMDKTEDYEELGEYWESLHPFCHWGGRFGDGNHFSISDSTIPGCVTVDGKLKK